jgi:hypothetical protein
MNPAEQILRDWGKQPRLMRATGTQLHKIREVIRPNHFIAGGTVAAADQQNLQQFIGTIIWDRVAGEKLGVFLIEHDWAEAFASAGEEVAGYEFRLPYKICLFDFQISGRRLGVVAFQRFETDYELHAVVEVPEATGYAYLSLNSPYQTAVKSMVERQVRGVCIALEAAIAETEIIRAPHNLNKSREKRGRTIVPDYHVVRLSSRSRASPLPGAEPVEEKRRGPRLHFRRGHWVHFANHKTWRKWTLVGNPDLGFIDKHYRL